MIDGLVYYDIKRKIIFLLSPSAYGCQDVTDNNFVFNSASVRSRHFTKRIDSVQMFSSAYI